VPGFFEFDIKTGQSVCFSAGISRIQPRQMMRAFNSESGKRIPRDNFENCLINASQQFVIKGEGSTRILAGYPWYSSSARYTFISLPGTLLITGEEKVARDVLETMAGLMKGSLFPSGTGNEVYWNQADAPLWFFWALQQYAASTGNHDYVWKTFGKAMGQVLDGYRDGLHDGIKMQENGLLSAAIPGVALTWMDAYAYEKPLTPRYGLAVEINALWYNAIGFYLELAGLHGAKGITKAWQPVFEQIPSVFTQSFWNPGKKYLADYIDGAFTDWTVRPNMILVASLPYSPVPEEIRKEVVSRVKQELLTPRGLRSLTPKSPVFKGVCIGDPVAREFALHHGTVWPWLLGHFAEGYLRIHGKGGLGFIKNLYEGFEPVVTEHGIGTVSEFYDGDPPHQPGGAISFAASVGELLRIKYLLTNYEKS